jgi:hypothetical protein
MLFQWAWKELGVAAMLGFIAAFVYGWWEAAPIHNTTILFLFVFLLVIGTLNYIEKRRARTRAQQVLAEITEVPVQPNAAALMPDLAELWTRLEQEMWWVWPSDKTAALYRKITTKMIEANAVRLKQFGAVKWSLAWASPIRSSRRGMESPADRQHRARERGGSGGKTGNDATTSGPSRAVDGTRGRGNGDR